MLPPTKRKFLSILSINLIGEKEETISKAGSDILEIRKRWKRVIIVIAGIFIGQFILYGPSLAGFKILLPLDILALPNRYIPQTPGADITLPHNIILSDLVNQVEPARCFAATELRAGRFPLWNPNQYAGTVKFTSNFSLFLMLRSLVASPCVIPWIELLAAVVAGMGAYVFARLVLQAAFWPAAIVGWCYPLTAFFVLWQVYGLAYPVVWLPWLLLAVDRTLRKASGLAAIGVAVLTFMALVAGELDIAGQVLLTSGLYGLWCYFQTYHHRWFSRRAVAAIASLLAGWCLGFLLAAPEILPTLEYARTGSRMIMRNAGNEERPPIGLAALPQIVLPNMYGSRDQGSYAIYPEGEGNLLESPAAAYTGILATLLLAPLGFCNPRRRSINVFWAALGFIGLGWSLNIPVLVTIFRMPGLNMMSHNRYVFATSFAIIALSAAGLDVLWRGEFKRRLFFCIFPMILAGLCTWCLYRAVVLPEPIATQLAAAVRGDSNLIRDLAWVRQVQNWFAHAYGIAAILCGIGVAGWFVIWTGKMRGTRLAAIIGVLAIADLLWFGYGRCPQCDPSLYYPKIPALQSVAKSAPGRVMGYGCLPARLAEMNGLRDIRGYDAVDPARLMDLMEIADELFYEGLPYAQTQWYQPEINIVKPDIIRLSPILDMLGVRYVIFRGNPPESVHPAFQSLDYWVLVNQNALPRTFVPNQVETILHDSVRLHKLEEPDFNPRKIAYVESPVNLPQSCSGTAEIVSEIPTRVTLAAHMETPGLVVLADLWDKGWRAYLNGRAVPILRTNHAVRGVIVPAGESRVEFRYEPASLALGLWCAGMAAVVLAIWGSLAFLSRRNRILAIFSPKKRRL